LINKLVFANLMHRPIRSLLGIIAIGVVVCMMLTLVGLSRGMLQGAAERAGGVGADVVVRPPGTSLLSLSSAPLNQRMTDFLASQEGVRLAVGQVVFPIGGIDTITGIPYDEFKELSGGFTFRSGGPLEKPDDILVDEYYAKQRKIRVGDRLSLINHDWRVSGIIASGKLARLVVSMDRLQELTGNEGKISQVFLRAAPGADIPQLIARLKEKLPGYPIYSMEEVVSFFAVENVPGLDAFINVIIAIAALVGFLVVFLSMYTAVLERTREIGILKSLGASPTLILRVILRESVLLSLCGAATGIVLSFGSRWAIQTFVPASLTQVLVPDWWGIAAVVALVGALLGTLYPAWRAASQDPIEALSYE
jgi:putative ABC transport system permease protein